MFWLMLAVIAVVVFGVAAVAAGQGATLGPADHELAGPAVDPGSADLAELTAARFPVCLRGYRMDAVDALIDRLGAEIAERDARIDELTARLSGGLGERH
jgi:DivIVA domain-containing protein